MVSYEVLHLCYHAPKDSFIGRLSLIRVLRAHHARHHDPRIMQRYNFNVTVPSHHGALIEFESGASAQTIFSFESHRSRTGFLEVSGTTGTIAFPDPNTFDGDSLIFDGTDDDGRTVPAVGSKATRGTGVAELAQAIRAGRPERATGAQAYHVLDIMVSIAESAERGETVTVESSFEKVPGVPEGWDPMVATL